MSIISSATNPSSRLTILSGTCGALVGAVWIGLHVYCRCRFIYEDGRRPIYIGNFGGYPAGAFCDETETKPSQPVPFPELLFAAPIAVRTSHTRSATTPVSSLANLIEPASFSD